jgi:hypothetical protein
VAGGAPCRRMEELVWDNDVGPKWRAFRIKLQTHMPLK